ncbi:MAG: MMPL family transporter, partial [Acidimicrobiales bacterium]
WQRAPHVTGVVNPFTAQAQIEESVAQLQGAKTQLDQAKKQLGDGQAKLDAAKKQVETASAQRAQLSAANPGDPRIPALTQQVEQGTAQIDQGSATLRTATAQYTAGKRHYDDGAAIKKAAGDTRMVSQGGRYAIVAMQFDDNPQSLSTADKEQIPDAAAAGLAAAGITPHYSQELTQSLDLVGPGEIVGLLFAVLVLVVVLGSLVAAGLPLLVALVGVGVGLAGAMALTSVVELNQTTPALALMLGLAVGIDYALFIVNRHRTHLLQGQPVVEAAARAVATAGSAVTFAGATVVIALAALVVSGIPLLGQMGLVAAATVLITVLVAVTMSPAVLRWMGTRVISKRTWRKHGYATPGDPSTRAAHDPSGGAEEKHGGAYVRAVTRRPLWTVLGVVIALGIIAIPAADMRLGLPDGGNEPAGSPAYATYALVGQEFGAGENGPIIAAATLPSTPTPRTDADVLHEQAVIATEFAAVDGVASVQPFGVSTDKTMLAFQIVPTTGPSATQTIDTLDRVQGSADAMAGKEDIQVGLTGQTVANIEISQRLSDALPVYLLVVVGLSLIILMIVFRSLLVPLIATLGFLLSVAAAFGAAVAVYQWGWLGSIFGVSHPGPLLSFMPTIVIGVLFG